MDIFLVLMLIISGVYLILLAHVACVERFHEAMLFKVTPAIFGVVLIALGCYITLVGPSVTAPMPTPVCMPSSSS